MARHKDSDWTLPARVENWEQVNTALLMDIRDELKAQRRVAEALLQLAQCYRLPRALDAVARLDKRLAKRVKL